MGLPDLFSISTRISIPRSYPEIGSIEIAEAPFYGVLEISYNG
jgi:hypothetical protein